MIAALIPHKKAQAGLALLCVLIVGMSGCGGSSDEGASIADETTAKNDSNGAKPSGKRTAKTETGGNGGEGEGADGTSKRAPDSNGKQSTREAIAEIPAEDRQSFAETAAANVLKALGIPNVDIGVSDDGYTVTVGVPQQYACGVTPSQIEEVKEKLKGVIISARRFRMRVQYAGPLAPYVQKNCPKLRIPSADGPLVYSQSGSGTHSSDELKIRSRRFTLAYVNAGGKLEIYAVNGEKALNPPIESSQHETGKQVYKGPGTFRVVTYGAGRWKIRVYDGA